MPAPISALPPFKVPYRTVEAALVRMHGIADDDVAAFRSRLGALQRGGLLGTSPGKGIKLEYEIDQFRRLILAIELAQAGLAPGVVLRLIRDSWDRLNKIFAKAERDNVILVLRPDLMFDETGHTISHATRDSLSRYIEFALGDERQPARLLLIDLSAQMRKFHDALSHYHVQPDQVAEAALTPKAKAPKSLKHERTVKR